MRFRIQGSYRSYFTDSFKTIRLSDHDPITPELEDVAINDKCFAMCNYCYTNALAKGTNFTNIIEKITEVYGSLSLNERPFQIATGGAGEPTLHPDFVEFVKTVRELDIIPNYTTNGMHFNDSILRATEEICGGVALSWHPHIKKVFFKAIDQLKEIKTKKNIHLILGDEQSFNDLKELYRKYNQILDYFVVLPYQAVGRAKEIQVENTWKQCFDWISTLDDKNKFAFGALFYPYLKNNQTKLNIVVYEPEKYSGYRILDDTYKILRKSSYNLEQK